MLLLIEIILTIFAWRKGWKWLALIPVGICLIMGFFIGIGIAAAGGSVSNAGALVIVDIFAIIALIIMNVKGPKVKEVENTTNTNTKENVEK
jgi:hypothetical protein